MIFLTRKSFCFLLSLWGLTACYFSPRVNQSNSFFSLPSVGGVGELSANTPSDSEYFYFDLDIAKYESSNELVPYYEISTTENFGDAEFRDSLSNCEIPLITPEDENSPFKENSRKNLICILDILEYDIGVKDLHLTYNFPEGMCDYVNTALPWHFNYNILPGPCVIECPIDTGEDNEDGSPIIEDRPCDRRPSDHYDNPDAPYGCPADDRTLEEICESMNATDCVGENRTIEDLCNGDPKCCYGGNKGGGEKWLPDLECFGGPALIAEGEEFGTSGNAFFNSRLGELPEGGLKGEFTLPNLQTVNTFAHKSGTTRGLTSLSTAHANYLRDLDREGDDLKAVSRENDLPIFLQKDNQYIHIPRLFFEFQCLDSAGEVLHQILLMIREWNTLEEFIDFYDDGGNDRANPDVDGEENKQCQYEDFQQLDLEIQECNDLLDFDDLDGCEDGEHTWCSSTDKYPKFSYPGNSGKTPVDL